MPSPALPATSEAARSGRQLERIIHGIVTEPTDAEIPDPEPEGPPRRAAAEVET